MRGWLILALALAAGCGPAAASGRTWTPVALPGGDEPYDLADDSDLALVRGDFDATPVDAPGRDALRRRLVDEYARRLEVAIDHLQRDAANDALSDLLELWSAAELRNPGAGRELVPHRAQLERARDLFARAGNDVEAVTALAALLLVEPERAAARRAEIDEIFAYADDLAVAENGEGSQRARPIEILERVVEVHPAPWVIDRLVTLYVERQAALEAHFRRKGADLEIIRAHGDGVVRTIWHVVRVLALGGRIDDAPAAIEQVSGIGDDPQLRERLRRALLPGATAPDWVLLAARYSSPDPDSGDYAAALALQREAIRRFPSSPAAYLAAAESASELGQDALAIVLYRGGLERDPHREDAAEQLAELYIERIDLLAKSRRPSAAVAVLRRFETFHRAEERALDRRLQPDSADALAAYGQGLVGLGELPAGTAALERSIELRATMSALESLGTVALKRDDHQRAIELYERALARPDVREPLGRTQQARILRLLAEAYSADGQRDQAARRLRAALMAWHQLTREAQDLPPDEIALALVEQGKILWSLGEQEAALVAFDAAIDADEAGASSHAEVIAFLVVHGYYDRALDAYHRALGSSELEDTLKVYMSLWMVAEAHRQHRPIDPIARDFLAGRDGSLWYDDLARFAAGRIGAGALQARATTRARRAELLYYSTVLGDDLTRHPDRARRKLESVVQSDMVLFFEYDMAKHWLDDLGKK